MESAKRDSYQPACMMSHEFLNKLSVIIGTCDLLQETADSDSPCVRRLITIREIAQHMANQLKQHQCQLDCVTRTMMLSRESVAIRTKKGKD